jgi:hypothetical protein
MPGAAAALKPLAWLALFGFLVGFFGFLAVTPPSDTVARADPAPAISSGAASGPASEEWNLPRHI